MPRALEQDELIEHWTLFGDEVALVAGKRGVNALAFGLLVRFYARQGRFPHGRIELPDQVVEFAGKQVTVPAAELGRYAWSGRTYERHRAEIRAFFGYSECSVADQTEATGWLVAGVTQVERRPEQVRAELLGWLRGRRLEPPTPRRIERIVRSALDRGESQVMERICALLSEETRARLNELVFGVPDEPATVDGGRAEPARDVLAWVKSDPGRLSLNTMLDEIAKLETIRAIGLPPHLLVWVSPKIVSGWRVRAAVQSPSHFRDFSPTTRWGAAVGAAGRAGTRDHRHAGGATDLHSAHDQRAGRSAGVFRSPTGHNRRIRGLERALRRPSGTGPCARRWSGGRVAAHPGGDGP